MRWEVLLLPASKGATPRTISTLFIESNDFFSFFYKGYKKK